MYNIPITPPTTFNSCTTLNQSPNLVLKSRAKSLLIIIVMKQDVKVGVAHFLSISM